MEKATHAKISNNAPFLVSILENARKTHMGIFSVFSITLVPGFSQNTIFEALQLICACREVGFLLYLGTGAGK